LASVDQQEKIKLFRRSAQSRSVAYELFELGRTKERRKQFVSLLVKEPAMEHEWFRTLVQEIRE
jgi:hypothetical protein